MRALGDLRHPDPEGRIPMSDGAGEVLAVVEVWRTTLIVEAHSARPGGRLRTNLCRPPWLLPGYLYEAAAGPDPDAP